jgi:hypothetical protein
MQDILLGFDRAGEDMQRYARLRFLRAQMRQQHFKNSAHVLLIPNMQIKCLAIRAKPIGPDDADTKPTAHPIKNFPIMLCHFQCHPHSESMLFSCMRFDDRHDGSIGIKKTSYICSFNFSTSLSYGVSSHDF